mmetsp:Transcript_62893/g.150478  ORF Transcript_62893/g.150478 Transcript_62893/m.150478 type:complete len:204 (-) Transcript_62893:3745-4356(-)
MRLERLCTHNCRHTKHRDPISDTQPPSFSLTKHFTHPSYHETLNTSLDTHTSRPRIELGHERLTKGKSRDGLPPHVDNIILTVELPIGLLLGSHLTLLLRLRAGSAIRAVAAPRACLRTTAERRTDGHLVRTLLGRLFVRILLGSINPRPNGTEQQLIVRRTSLRILRTRKPLPAPRHRDELRHQLRHSELGTNASRALGNSH